jgi:hypothetical protein
MHSKNIRAEVPLELSKESSKGKRAAHSFRGRNISSIFDAKRMTSRTSDAQIIIVEY